MSQVRAQPFQFREQIAFLLGKVNVPTQGWTDVWRDGHDAGFMVAGAYKAELLADFRQAVNQAITDHRSLDDFRKDFDRIVAKHGWSYNGTRGWRTRTIFETNLRSSYQAGRYAQLTDPEFLKLNPYWRYKHSDAVHNPRTEHLAWNGLVIPANDPWWQTHFPPNGWGCKCRVFAESDRSLKRKGKTPDAPPGGGTQTTIVGQRSGHPRSVTTPIGIDPGWDYAPGATRAAQVRQALLIRADQVGGQLGLDLKAATQKIPEAPVAPKQGPQSLAEFVSAGEAVLSTLQHGGGELTHARMVAALAEHRPVGKAVALASRGEAAQKVAAVSRWLPDAWTDTSAKLGKLAAKQLPGFGRSYYRHSYSDGLLALSQRSGLDVALHELMHRIQQSMPELDRFFQDLHRRRTAGANLKPLTRFGRGYRRDEFTREDDYVDPYQGKEYRINSATRIGQPLEVITMAFQAVWGGRQDLLRMMLDKDPEMVHLVLGLLWNFKL